MSVVNKMLQDLEARKAQPDEIKADYQPPAKKPTRLWFFLLLTLAIFAIVFALTGVEQLFEKSQSSEVAATNVPLPQPPVVAKKMNLAPVAVQTESLQKESIQREPTIAAPSQSPEVSAQMSSVKVKTKGAVTDNVIASNPTTNTQILPANPELANVQIIPDQQLASTDMPQVTTTSTDILAPESTQTSSFSMTGSSAENNRDTLKQRISESLNDDNFDLAKSLLNELLRSEPDNIKARKKLASLQFAHGNYAQAKQLLVRGIELHPAQADLRLMLARLYVIQKQTTQALDILIEYQPSLTNQSEYLAYRAALAQQLKQAKLAKLDYQSLTKIEPANAKWWLGLAIAEDQLGEINMALQAYNQANVLGQLEGSVVDFVQQRISVLAGAQ